MTAAVVGDAGSYGTLLIRADHEVVWLQVTMTDVVAMHVLCRLEKLAHNAADEFLTEDWL